MKSTLIILALFSTIISKSYADSNIFNRELKIEKFATDGCSSFPDGSVIRQTNEWEHCCMVHDVSYWMGGEYKKKLAADKELRTCVSSESSNLLGTVMQTGVFFGGAATIPTTWRWSYGWNFVPNVFIGYKELDEEEYKEVLNQFETVINGLADEKARLTEKQMKYIRYKVIERIEELTPYSPNNESQIILLKEMATDLLK